MFTRKGRCIDTIPSTADDLLLHDKWVLYQDGYCLGQASMPIRTYPVQENGNGAKDLTKIGNICGLQFRNIRKLHRTTSRWFSRLQKVHQKMQVR